MKRITVGLAGVTGYAGQELLRLLRTHPDVTLTWLGAGAKTDPDVALRHHGPLPVAARPFDPTGMPAARAVFLALPHEASLAAAPVLLDRGARVFDLSAAYRLKDARRYDTHYGFAHTERAWLAKAVYGLPETHGAELRKAKLVAVPGCYPTGPILALTPLLRHRLIAGPVIVDAKSGVTGAGAGLRSDLMYSEVHENFRAYGVFSHRHEPEIAQELARAAGRPVALTFTPHLVPMNRGILSTIYATLAPGVTRERVLAAWTGAYPATGFVRVWTKGLPETRSVRNTNRCDLGIAVRGRQAIVVTAIDNLVKGAAGQAVQAFNVAFGLPAGRGLDLPAGAP